MTILDQILASGEPFAFERVENLDWFDQPLASVAKVRDFGWVLHLLVAWNADERRGVRLYFPITNTMASSLTVEAVALEEIEATLSAIVSNYRGYLLVSIESEPYLSEAGKILESKECSTLSKPCLNLDRIMNNAEMTAWIALAEGA